jgi:5'-nucleotidase
MPYNLSELLVVAISSSVLFDTRDAHDIFESKGLDEYVSYQIANEDTPLGKGTAFHLIEAMLRLNTLNGNKRIVEAVILSKNEPEAGLRIMNSVEHHKLDITRAAFTGGEAVTQYLRPYNVSLFLSRDEKDVKDALELGFAAGLLYNPPEDFASEMNQLRIAFDGDAVIFSDDSEKIFQEKGINAFFEYERQNASKPLPEGPFAPFLKLIAKIQKDQNIKELDAIPPIETALVTARNGPAHERVIRTLRAWDIKINQMFFLGGISKDQVLKEFRPHIFFDDQDVHVEPASHHVPSARVPAAKKKKIKDDPNQLKLLDIAGQVEQAG